MSALNKGKHIIGEIDGVRCTIVESGISAKRVDFLKEILEFNKFEVKVSKDATENEETFTLGVTSILFNPVIAVYERSLKTPDGQLISAGYWNQKTTVCDPRYWIVRRKLL